MLKTKDLIENVDEKFVPMLKEVNIPDFTKCIATMTWRGMDEVNDRMIKEYLLQWAKSKYRFYQMLGNKTRIDCPFTYKRLKEETRERMVNLAQDFPAYYPWLEACRCMTANKMTSREIGWEFGKWMADAFPNFRWEGSSLTRFFKSCLQAPDELINRIAQAFENNTVNATYTISIDPVDIMLASENPYDWGSCYRLDPRDDENHADGCLASVLDTSTLITYVWNKEGEFLLGEDKFKFKSIRYKKMRAWISIAPDFNAFYMNRIYPGKNDYGEEFEKTLRVIIEKTISDYTKLEDKWERNYSSMCQRKFPYGYEEHDNEDSTFVRAGFRDVVSNWFAYDVRILCPCGCGLSMPGFYDGCADEQDNAEYNGDGYGCSGIREQYYCDYSGDYCDCNPDDDDCCCDCCYWQDAHPVCSLDESTECIRDGEGDPTVRGGIARACFEDCQRCRIWEHYNPEQEDETELSEGADDSSDDTESN